MQDPEPMIIDTDVHNQWGDLTEYLPRVWHDSWRRQGPDLGKCHDGNPRGYARRDANTPSGGIPGSDPEFLIAHHLDPYDIDYAILTGPCTLGLGPDPDYRNAVARAANDCTLERWLPVSPRFLGSIVVNSDDPPAAAAEIRRCAGKRSMVQVLMTSVSRRPYGQRAYHPIYEAAAEAGLPIAVHPGQEGAGQALPPTPVGYPSRYMEWHNIIPITYMAQVNSLVCEGVFEKFPTLMFVGLEGGLAWLPHLMWRMDKNYLALRDSAPWLHRLPSEYVMAHVRLSTQPIEEPADVNDLYQMFRLMHAEKTVVFSSDYPHWDNDNPMLILNSLPTEFHDRIAFQTAAELYGISERAQRTVNRDVPALAGVASLGLVNAE